MLKLDNTDHLLNNNCSVIEEAIGGHRSGFTEFAKVVVIKFAIVHGIREVMDIVMVLYNQRVVAVDPIDSTQTQLFYSGEFSKLVRHH